MALQSPVGSLHYGGQAPGVYIGGSPYSTTLREHPLTTSSIPAYSMWGSDSSQLYRASVGSSKAGKEKKQVCSTLLMTTAALVVMSILAIAAVAAYLGGKFIDFQYTLSKQM